MKPPSWDALPTSTKRRLAVDLNNSRRGKYLIAQALALGIRALQEVPEQKREISSIQDMEILREMIYTLPIHIEGVGIV
jgi:hypothetical protein